MRAVWVVHGPVGLVVMPARWTRRVPVSMTNRTWSLRRVAVSTHAKSVAVTAAAWERMNSTHVGPVRWSRVDAGLAQDVPHARRGDGVAEPAEFAVDTPVSPGRVLGSEAPNELAKLGADRRSASSSRWRLRPAPGDQTPVPAEHGGGLHDQHHVGEAPPVDHRTEHSEDCAVGVAELCTADLTLQHVDLVSEGQDSASRVSPVAKNQRNRVITSRAMGANRAMAGAR